GPFASAFLFHEELVDPGRVSASAEGRMVRLPCAAVNVSRVLTEHDEDHRRALVTGVPEFVRHAGGDEDRLVVAECDLSPAEMCPRGARLDDDEKRCEVVDLVVWNGIDVLPRRDPVPACAQALGVVDG